MKSIYQFLLILLLGSCAHIVPPDGGIKDTNPPKLIKANPLNNSLNIFPSKVILTFNENIELVNMIENVRLTPDINTLPKLKVIKNRLSIQFSKDSLKPNTTYTLNFGDALVDLNEKNILKNFNYTFSTGLSLDSNYIKGKAVAVKDKSAIDKCLITLINTDKQVKYTTKSALNGDWKIMNISSGNYELFIFDDKNLNKKPDLKESYYSKKFHIDSSIDMATNELISYNVSSVSKLFVLSAKYINDYIISIKFSKAIEDRNKIKYSLMTELNKKEPSLILTEKKDSLLLYHPFIETDTLYMNIETDTLQKILIKQPKKRKIENMRIDVDLPIVRPEDDVFFSSNIPIKLINSKKISINGSYQNFEITKNASYKMSLKHNQNGKVKVIFEAGSLNDLNGKENTGDTINFRTAEPEETGNYEFTIKDTLLNFKGIVMVKIYNENSSYLIKTEINKINKINGLLPGTYALEAWQDVNSNSIWDEGNYMENINPEKIRLLKNFVIIKPNWDSLGVEIYMN